jgi:hypothetical protein
MGEVNSHGESWLSESDSHPVSAPGGEQPTPENSGAPGLFSADQPPERPFALGMLAEGKGFELAVNIVVCAGENGGRPCSFGPRCWPSRG